MIESTKSVQNLFTFINESISGGRFVVTSQGHLHIRAARAEDGRATYSCLTLHALTGERRRSEPATLTVTGMFIYLQFTSLANLPEYWPSRQKIYCSRQPSKNEISRLDVRNVHFSILYIVIEYIFIHSCMHTHIF